MKIPKVSFEETLEKSVVFARKCVGCAACIVVCPFNCLDYVEQKPKIITECKVCGICPQVCPQYDLSWPALEEFVFGRRSKPEEKFGIHKRLVIAQATDKNILQVCQDGGVVSALLSFALRNETIDGAAISGISKERTLYPVPRLATTSEEVLECAGTRYFYSPNLLALQEGVKQNRKSIAFVGTPCQTLAIRRIQMVPLKKYTKKLGFVIGLMCTESFTYQGLMEKHIQGIMGINPQDIKKINIKGKVLITMKNGETKNISLSEAKQYTRTSCVLCSDFSAELADISVGGLGLSNWTFTVLRTKKGEELFEEAEKAHAIKTRPVEKEEKALDLLSRLSMKKRKRR
jgi:coenzyme F420 hydrogenase subunit beta